MPSSRSRRARRLVNQIEAASSERRDGLAEASNPHLTAYLARELDALHQSKRSMRRELYAQRDDLEGRPVYRATPGPGA